MSRQFSAYAPPGDWTTGDLHARVLARHRLTESDSAALRKALEVLCEKLGLKLAA